MNQPENFEYDVRIRKRMLARGRISSEGLNARLAQLPDVSRECEVIELEQPALISEKEVAPEPPMAGLVGLGIPPLADPAPPLHSLGLGGRVSPLDGGRIPLYESAPRMSAYEPLGKIDPFEPPAPLDPYRSPTQTRPNYEIPGRVSPFEPVPKVNPFEPAPKVSPFEPAGPPMARPNYGVPAQAPGGYRPPVAPTQPYGGGYGGYQPPGVPPVGAGQGPSPGAAAAPFAPFSPFNAPTPPTYTPGGGFPPAPIPMDPSQPAPLVSPFEASPPIPMSPFETGAVSPYQGGAPHPQHSVPQPQNPYAYPPGVPAVPVPGAPVPGAPVAGAPVPGVPGVGPLPPSFALKDPEKK